VLASSLPRMTKRTLTASALRTELAIVREQGFATEKDEAVLGESSAAAPIFSHGPYAVGAIGTVGPTEDVFAKGLARGMSTAVIEAARGVSRELGASGWPPPVE
jgi:DNA-binding IclR family transcriptional regulator